MGAQSRQAHEARSVACCGALRGVTWLGTWGTMSGLHCCFWVCEPRGLRAGSSCSSTRLCCTAECHTHRHTRTRVCTHTFTAPRHASSSSTCACASGAAVQAAHQAPALRAPIRGHRRKDGRTGVAEDGAGDRARLGAGAACRQARPAGEREGERQAHCCPCC